ncbi:MAG: enoyl-CoA hydratase-related protein [bacterium]
MTDASVVRLDRVGTVMVLVLTHPPVNALSSAVRQGLSEGLAQALADPDVTAIIIRGEGKGFSAGADIAEFGKVSPVGRLGDLCLQIEAATKPVIAAIHGTALGGGLEIALASHYRIANAAAFVGLPEVNLGLLPGAGGTQRLPRLIGAAEALRLMLDGAPVRAAEAMALGMIDRVVEAGLPEAALAMAAEGLTPRRTCDMRRGLKDMAGYQAAVTAARAAHRGTRLPAPARIIDCVEAAALLPIRQGLYMEEAAFADLVATPEAAGLRYAFFTERRAALPPQAVAARGITQVGTLGIWGVDDMAADLAFQALTSGMRVVWAAEDRAALIAALERTAGRQEQAVVAGLMTEDTRDADWARLVTSLTPETLAGVEVLLTTSDAAALPDSLAGIAQAAMGAVQHGGGPKVAITVPYAAGGMAELSMARTAPVGAVAVLVALARRMNWRVVYAGPGGPIELNLRQALAAAVAYLHAAGVSPDLVTAALASYGIGTGPLSVLPPMPAGGETVVAACLLAMAAEGARMLQEGRARRPLDIDAVALMTGLMPRWSGGPMFQADLHGLLVMRKQMLDLAEEAAVFLPAELIDDLLAEGQNFASLNAR